MSRLKINQAGFLKLTKHTLVSYLIIATIFFGGGLFFLFNPFNKSASAVWFDDNWGYRKAITVTVTTNASDITNLQTLITVDTTGITAKLQSACQDLRFTNTNGKILPYYIDTCSNNSATNKIWVMADLVPKNTTTYTVYMYYGNPTAVAGSDSSSKNFNLVKNLTGYWTLNETSGNRTDSSVNGNTLTDTNTVTSNTGQYSNAGQFTRANSENLIVTDKAALSTGNIDFTFSAWVYMDANVAASTYTILSKWTASGSHEYILYKTSADRFTFIVSNDGTASNTVAANSLGAPSTGTWYFVVAWHDSVNNTLNIQVNNGAVDSAAFSLGGFDTAAPFSIGEFNSTSYWDGRIDDVRMYKRVLNSDERTQLYTNPGTIATTAVGTITPSTAFASEEKATAPVAYWKFDEGTGTNAKDSTVNSANNGTLTSGPTWQTEDQCLSGKCIKFDGTNDYVNAGTSDTLAITGNITYEAWVRPNSYTSGGTNTDRGGIMIKRGFIYMTINSSTGTLDVALAGPMAALTSSTSTVPLNTWSHIAFTYDGSNVRWYINGRLDKTLAKSGAISNSTGEVMNIGGEGSSNFGRYFNGFIDEPRIYNYARSTAQLAADYNARSNNEGASGVLGSSNNQPAALSNGLVGYWKMDEASWATDCSTTSITDSSGNSNNGQPCPNGSAAAIGVGKFGNGAVLDGTNDYLNVANATSLNMTTAVTMSAWVKSSGSNDFAGIIQKALNGSSSGYQISLRAGNTGVRADFSATGGTVSPVNSTNVEDGNWHLVTAVWNGSQAIVYVDGLPGTAVATSGTLGTTTDPLVIGNDRCCGSRFFTGTIDEARVYNRALSSADVATLYNFAPGPVGYWKLDERTGTSTFDASGNANTGTLQSMASPSTATSGWNAGKYGGGLAFDGSNDYVSLANESTFDFPSSGFTLNAWVYSSTLGSQTAEIINKYAASDKAWEIFVLSGKLKLCVYGTGGGQLCRLYNTALSNNTWTYVSGTYNGGTTSSAIDLYLNGVLVDDTADDAGTFTALRNSAAVAAIGATSEVVAPFSGKIDDIKVYSYVRTQGQIIEDMNASHPAPGSPVGTPLGYWKMDEGYDGKCTGGTNDVCNYGSQGSTLDGAQSGMASPATSTSGWTQAGKFGKALNFDGTDDFVDINQNSALKPTTGVTVSAWVKRTGNLADFDGIFTSPESAGGNGGYALIGRSGNKAWMYIDTTGSGGWATATSTTTLAVDTWYHLVGTWDGSNVRIYVNGQLEATTTAATMSYGTTATNARIGRYFTTYWPGQIDEVKYYGQALTADQVKLDMNRGSNEVLGAVSDNSSYQANAANQEYCVPGDSTSCAAPVGRWDFEEGTGSSANDSSGGNGTGTITGATFKTGKQGKALNFNGSTDTVSVSNSLSTKTVEFWVNPTTTTQNLMDLRTAATAANISVSSGTISATGFTTPTIYVNGAVSSTLVANSWQHVAITTGTAITANAIQFGRISSTSLTGKLDTVRFFDYARSGAQIAWDYNRGGPVGWWKMDECQGTVVKDYSGFVNNGTVTIGGTGTQTTAGTCSTASTAWGNGVTGKRNYSLNFDGSDDYVNVAHNAALAITGDITISAWVKVTDFANYNGIVGKTITNQPAPYDFYLTQTSGLPSFNVGNGGGSEGVNGTKAPATGTWQHIAVTMSSKAVTHYLNAVSNGTGTIGAGTAISDGGGALRIGSRADGATLMKGSMDDVRIYNYALTATQIKGLYNNGSVTYGPVTGAP